MIVPAALRRTTTPSAPSGVSSPASKQRHASQPAKRSTCANGGGPPLLVADEQERRLGEVGGPGGERAQGAEREHHAALHVDGARAEQLVAVARVSGLWCAWAITVSTWPSRRIRRVPVPRSVASRSGAWPGEEQGTRSTRAASGSSAAQIAAHSSAPWTSPDGEDTATSASSSRSARARDRVGLALDPGMHARRTLEFVRMPELPEMEIAARRLAAALPGRTIESALAPGINALKTFDPPLHALEGRAFTGVSRRGKLLMLELEGDLVVLVHLMSAGRIQLQPKRAVAARQDLAAAAPAARTTTSCACASSGRSSAAWVKVLRADELDGDESLAGLGPEAWPDPPPLRELLDAPRPLHTLLRDQQVITGIGRTWVDEILNVAKLSPFKRGDDLDDERGGRAARRDGLRARPRDRRLRGEPSSSRCPRSTRSRRASTPTRASRARSAGRCSRPCSTRTTS